MLWCYIFVTSHSLLFRFALAILCCATYLDERLFSLFTYLQFYFISGPFRVSTWQGIGIMFVFAMFLMVAPCICVKGYTETTAFSIITTSGWFFFVLINAYYGGALTMFFVSEITLPFNTIRDALRAFPTWNFMYQAGNDAYFEIPASQVIAVRYKSLVAVIYKI